MLAQLGLSGASIAAMANAPGKRETNAKVGMDGADALQARRNDETDLSDYVAAARARWIRVY